MSEIRITKVNEIGYNKEKFFDTIIDTENKSISIDVQQKKMFGLGSKKSTGQAVLSFNSVKYAIIYKALACLDDHGPCCGLVAFIYTNR